MAEQEIKRLNYFDGLFLKSQEFQDEQYYHRHMRRRLNYVLFGTGGVVNPDDLKFEINNSTFKVKAGMAICINESEKEAKEIILTEDSESKSITGSKIWVKLYYNEENTEKSSAGGTEDYTRTVEKPVIQTSETKPDAEGEDYVILGAIESGSPTWQANYDDREEAKIRASLIGAAPVTPVPTITNINVVGSIVPGQTVAMTITGTNLGNNPVVTILDNSDNPDTAINSSNITSTNPTQLVVALVIGSGAALGGRKVRVVTDGRTVTSSPDAFVVIASAIVLVSIAITPPSPPIKKVGDTGTFTATGTFSDLSTRPLTHAADGLQWSSNPSGIIDINPQTGAAKAISDDTVTIKAQVGTVSGQTIVKILPAAIPPEISFIAPDRQISRGVIDAQGTNIRDSSILPPNPATGTTIRFVKGLDSKDGTDVIARPNKAGRQVVRVTVPDRNGTSWGNKEEVTLELKFNGLTATVSFKYDD
jgi:hypothetical protein